MAQCLRVCMRPAMNVCLVPNSYLWQLRSSCISTPRDSETLFCTAHALANINMSIHQLKDRLIHT